MAINNSTNPNYAGRVTAQTPEYPYGSSKNESSPGAGDGTPYNKERANDVFGLQQSLLSACGIVPSGNADNVLDSQYMQALVELICGRAIYRDIASGNNFIALVPKTNQYKIASYFVGLTVKFTCHLTNVSGMGISIDGLAQTSIRRPSGTALKAKDLDVGDEVTVVYDGTNFILDMSGKVEKEIFTSSGTYTKKAGVKSVKVTAIGGGGGGANSNPFIGGGGAGGATVISWFKNAELASSTAVNVAAGGAGSTGVGGDGGNTTFGSVVIAAGGGRGGFGSLKAGGSPLSGSVGDMVFNGSYGSNGSSSGEGGGNGGSSSYGSGGSGSQGGAIGSASSGEYGGGGAGSDVIGDTAGDGGNGLVIIEEFY